MPAGRLSADAPGLAGLPIAVAGRVLAVQKLGASQQVIQVRPMTVQESAAFLASPEFARVVANEANRTSLAATSLESDVDYYELTYCNLPARPFFTAQPGEALLFNGTLIASGRTEFAIGPQAGKKANLTYLACSSAERIPLEIAQ